MNHPASHAWVHGLGYHPTRDAECACGVEVHDIGGKGARKVEYRDPSGRAFSTLPPCTRADDERSSQ